MKILDKKDEFYTEWTMRDKWLIIEFVCLMYEVNPDEIEIHYLSGNISITPKSLSANNCTYNPTIEKRLQKIKELYKIICTWEGSNLIRSPFDYIEKALSKEMKIPIDLLQAVIDQFIREDIEVREGYKNLSKYAYLILVQDRDSVSNFANENDASAVKLTKTNCNGNKVKVNSVSYDSKLIISNMKKDLETTLSKPRKGKLMSLRKEAIEIIIKAIEKLDSSFNPEKMPGQKNDFLNFCVKLCDGLLKSDLFSNVNKNSFSDICKGKNMEIKKEDKIVCLWQKGRKSEKEYWDKLFIKIESID